MSIALTNRWQFFPQAHRKIIAACALAIAAIILWPTSHGHDSNTQKIKISDSPITIKPDNAIATSKNSTTEEVKEPLKVEPIPLQYTIKQGDTLSNIFAKFRVSRDTMKAVLAADEDLLALDVLKPGQTIVFHFGHEDFKQTLQSMELIKNPAYKVTYERADASHFSFKENKAETVWEDKSYAGTIDGSFYKSAKNAGLSDKEIMRTIHIFREKFNFARQTRSGDRFQIIVGEETVGDSTTGNTRIEGIRLHTGGKTLSAFLHEDGHFYSQDGKSLGRDFLTRPTDQRFRVSSPFNPNRRHPITGKVSPHNGVDFAAPMNTPVLSIGDGVVTRVKNHPFAGKYVEIEHNSTYKTRYLHLNSYQVNRGDHVKRGQVIARSGNTGRSTGPHLHFELHVNNRPVNALKANLPTISSIDKKALPKFNERVAALEELMDKSIKEG